MNTTSPTKIALTMGDPAGIGAEIIVQAWAQDPHTMSHCYIAGDKAVMQRAVQVCQQHLPHTAHIPQLLHFSDWQSATKHPVCATPHHMPVVQACQATAQLPAFGSIQTQAGRMAAQCIENATHAVLNTTCDALVTAPIHKVAFKQAGIEYPGHTEMLQALCAQHAGVPVADMPVRMMLANNDIKVVLNSVHVSLRQAIEAVQHDRIVQTARIAEQFLTQQLHKNGINRTAIIALAGLNPHAGEAGRFGDEEIQHIEPARNTLAQQGLHTHGPYAPDTIFMTAREQSKQQPPFCDAIIAMYHDQGLIPVKYLGLDGGVNVTLGLPILRTSPDHGTAFELAGTARADCASLLAAVRLALQMAAA